MDDDLAVDDEAAVGQSPHRARHFRKCLGQVVPVSGHERTLSLVQRTQHAVPIVLDLEQPSFPREGILPGLRHHQFHGGGPEFTFGGARLDQLGPQDGTVVAPLAQLVDGEAGEDRIVRVVLRGAVRVFVGVALLDEEPVIVLAPLVRTRVQRPRSLYPLRSNRSFPFAIPPRDPRRRARGRGPR